MAKIVWKDKNGKQFESRYYSKFDTLRNYIEHHIQDIVTVVELDCSGLSSLTDVMRVGIFQDCVNLKDVLKISNTTKVKALCNMFSNCKSLKSVPYFDTSKVINMDCMFYGCNSLAEVPPLCTKKVKSGYMVFDGCSISNFGNFLKALMYSDDQRLHCLYTLKYQYSWGSLEDVFGR